jgi:hypothetical protein
MQLYRLCVPFSILVHNTGQALSFRALSADDLSQVCSDKESGITTASVVAADFFVDHLLTTFYAIAFCRPVDRLPQAS